MDWFTSLLGLRRKASAARSLFAIDRPGAAVWSARRYDAFADEGYRKNVIAFSAVNMVAGAAASLPWRLFRTASARRVAVAEHPLLTLLARPNPWSGGPALLSALYGYRLIAGNGYLEAVSGDSANGSDSANGGGGSGGLPVELYALRPDRMTIIAGAAGSPAAYRYSLGGRSRDFPVDALDGRSAILHFKSFHPLDDWYGLSPIEAAAYAIDQHNQAGAWNQALLQNGARPSGALMVQAARDGAGGAGGSGGALDDDQFERLKSQIDQLYSGPKNAGRPLLLEGGLTWREMSLSPKDMDFIAAKHTSARDIALAFGVPPQLLGIPGDNTYANMREARLALWEQTVLPLAAQLKAEFNNWLTPRYGDALELDQDLDAIPALALQRERQWQKLVKTDFLTLNEKRAAAGYGALEGGDALPRPRRGGGKRDGEEATLRIGQ